MTYRICTKCIPNHYENCEGCFGFGFRKRLDGSVTPTIAIEARDFALIPNAFPRTIFLKCPECSSTVEGIPKKE